MPKEVVSDWQSIKNLIDSGNFILYYIDHNDNYFLSVTTGNLTVTAILDQSDPDNEDLLDFENNYKENANKVKNDINTGALIVRPTSDLIDSFGRNRVVEPVILFETAMTYNKRPELFSEKTSGDSTITHNTDSSLVNLEVGTSLGDQITRQTRRYFRYQVARTHYKTYVAILGASKSGVVKRVGGFDDTDGFYFEMNGDGLAVVRRDSTSGSVVDEKVQQANWNQDRLDGTGPSGITLDSTNLVIYGDKFNWHGGGPVTLGIYKDGRFNPCHTFEVSNVSQTPITALPNVPIRYEILNTGTPASSTSMQQGASSAMIDGGLEIDQSVAFSANNGITTRAVSSTTPVPLIALRPKLLFEGRTNRTAIKPISFNIHSSETLILEIVFGGTISGGTWESVSSNSASEVNRGGTSITGGRVIASDYLPGSQGSRSEKLNLDILEDLFLALNIDGDSQETITITARTLTSSTTVLSSINWTEAY